MPETSGKTSARHVIIVGAGAVGLTLAAVLRQGPHRVTLAVRRMATNPLPLTFRDEIADRTLSLEDAEWCPVTALPRTPDHVIVCTRGEQLEMALHTIAGQLGARVPITVAAATLDDLGELGRRAGVRGPVQRLGLGFGSWPIAPGFHRLFAVLPSSTIAVEPEVGCPKARDDLAGLFSRLGLPMNAAPTMPFQWLFRSGLAAEVAWLLSYRRSGWELDELASGGRAADLCGRAMREATLLVREEAGPVAWLASMVPPRAFARVAAWRARRANESVRAIWRHHGPKTDAQLDFLSDQLRERAGGRLPEALHALVNARARAQAC